MRDRAPAVDAADNVLLVWSASEGTDGFHVFSLWRSPTMGWDATPTMLDGASAADDGGFLAAMRVDPAGNAITIWDWIDGVGDSAGFASLYRPGSGWTAPERIGDPALTSRAAGAAFTGDGRALAAYIDEASPSVASTVEIDVATGTWSPTPTPYAVGMDEGSGMRIAGFATGGWATIWRQRDSVGDDRYYAVVCD